MKDTLALCIPAYNAENYLSKLLYSACSQPVPFDEILIYDDCSTDRTAEIAGQYDVKIISGEVNQGCSYGKNVLAAHTACTWIHFHDADDDLMPGFTRQVHQWISANNNHYQALLLPFEYRDAVSGQLLATVMYNADELHADALKYAIQHKIVNFGVYNKKAFMNAGGFDLDVNVLYNEDNALHQRLAKSGLKFDCLPQVTCINYRYAESMSSSNYLKCAQANYHVLEKTAATHGCTYSLELAEKLWLCIANLAAAQDWEYVKKGLVLTKTLGYGYAVNGSNLFNYLTKINPYAAVWGREKLIRLFKPHLRGGQIK